MFGYIRPLQGELKVRELERFKAVYCGLCHVLGKRYGVAARFILGYELVFLSMLLWDDTPPVIYRKRCIASPFRKKRYCSQTAALETCAGYSVILTWWKLRDSISDEGFVKSLIYRVGALFLRRAYKKASRDFAEFDSKVKTELKRLSEHEKEASGGGSERTGTLDSAADKFALILKAAVPDDMPENKRRPMLEMLYHLGRWIYIIDACDDYNDDLRKGRYNPVLARIGPQDGRLPPDAKERLMTTLTHSGNLLCAAYELINENIWSDIIRNMIYLGMPDICGRVLEGDWRPKKREHP